VPKPPYPSTFYLCCSRDHRTRLDVLMDAVAPVTNIIRVDASDRMSLTLDYQDNGAPIIWYAGSDFMGSASGEAVNGLDPEHRLPEALQRVGCVIVDDVNHLDDLCKGSRLQFLTSGTVFQMRVGGRSVQRWLVPAQGEPGLVRYIISPIQVQPDDVDHRDYFVGTVERAHVIATEWQRQHDLRVGGAR
jgi:hypothetical protein